MLAFRDRMRGTLFLVPTPLDSELAVLASQHHSGQAGAGGHTHTHTCVCVRGWEMEIDDEDPAWLEACMAAVDSIPVANLNSTGGKASETPARRESSNSRPCGNPGGAPSSHNFSGASRRTSLSTQNASHFPPPGSNAAVAAPMGGNINYRGVGGIGSTTAPHPRATLRIADRASHFSHSRSNDGNHVGNRGVRRTRGVGISVSG